MLEVRNRTPFCVTILPGLEKNGTEQIIVLIKGSFALRGSSELPVGDEQVPIVLGDKHYGKPDVSSVQYESDHCPGKPGTDIVLLGHAQSSTGSVETLDVELRVGSLRKVVRVFGQRFYYRSAVSWRISSPERFSRMPLIYERAFGGEDISNPDPANHAREERNPVGVGFVGPKSAKSLDGALLPNLEDPADLIGSPQDRPPPAGFGFIGRSWQPRARYAGTFDQRWQKERSPLLPLDFDARFYQGAHPDLVSRTPLRGGEPVVVTNVTADREPLAFHLPARSFEVGLRIKDRLTTQGARLDTVVIEPNNRRVVLCWRAAVPCPRSFLYIERVMVREAARS